MQDIEIVFDVNAARNGLTVIRKGWPDRLVVDKQGNIFFVEVKRADEPLRPHQYKVMTLLESIGVRVYISPNGTAEPTEMVALDEWLVTSSSKGRPAIAGSISRTTARSYGYKAKQLLAQAEVAEATPGFPKERLVELRARAHAMLKKASSFWDGSDKEFLKEVVVLERESGAALENMQALFRLENEKAVRETEDRVRLEEKANNKLTGGQ